MLRQAVPGLLMTAALALCACGRASDADKVRTTYNEFHRALASDAPATACAFMTGAGRKRYADASGAVSCEAAAEGTGLMLTLSGKGDEARAGLRNFRARGVIFADAHTKAVIQPDQVAIPEPWEPRDDARPIVMVERDGAWLIEDLGT